MNDNQIIALIISIMRSGLDSIGLNDVLIKQQWQPRQSGIETQDTLYLSKILATRYGFPSRKDVYDESTGQFTHTETIWRTPTFQFSGYALQNPDNVNETTASDITEMAADVMQTSATRLLLLDQNVGIIRITDVRENYFVNERGRYQQNPSFDFVLSYRFTLTNMVSPVDQYCIDTHPVLN